MLDATALAYLGDSVIEIYVREKLVTSGIARVGELNEKSHAFVTAVAQSTAYRRIESLLTEAETDIFHRARNSSHIGNVPRSATNSQYRAATGFEAVFGWLYLCGDSARIRFLLDKAYSE